MRLDRVGPPRIRVAIDVSILTNPITFASTFAVWFVAGLAAAVFLGLVR